MRTAVGDVLGTAGDPTVLDYICGCLEDFEFGEDAGEEAFDSFGAMMVGSCRPVAQQCGLPEPLQADLRAARPWSIYTDIFKQWDASACITNCNAAHYRCHEHCTWCMGSTACPGPGQRAQTILDYIVEPMQVDAGCVPDDAAARAACDQLTARLGGGATAAPVEAFRALAGAASHMLLGCSPPADTVCHDVFVP